MFVRESGSGPAVLLLHGIPSSPDDFAPLVERLSRSRRVLVPEMPGYARTPMDEATYSFRRSWQLIEEALAERGVTETAVVGFSGGALRAFSLAIEGRLRVSALVSLGGYAGLDETGRKVMRDFAVLARGVENLRLPDLVQIFVARMLSPAHAAAHPEAVEVVTGWLDCIAPSALAVELFSLAESEDLYPRLGELRVPVLARVGSLDMAAPPSMSERIARAVPGAMLQCVEGSGHALMIEDRDGTVESVARFLGA